MSKQYERTTTGEGRDAQQPESAPEEEDAPHSEGASHTGANPEARTALEAKAAPEEEDAPHTETALQAEDAPETKVSRAKYPAAVRRAAAEMLEAGAGRRTIARDLNIPEDTARQWARAYAVGGVDAVLNAGEHRAVYDKDLKLAAVKDHLERGKTIREVMVTHKIYSESAVKAWCRAYRAGGAKALDSKPRGRPPKP